MPTFSSLADRHDVLSRYQSPLHTSQPDLLAAVGRSFESLHSWIAAGVLR